MAIFAMIWKQMILNDVADRAGLIVKCAAVLDLKFSAIVI